MSNDYRSRPWAAVFNLVFLVLIVHAARWTPFSNYGGMPVPDATFLAWPLVLIGTLLVTINTLFNQD